MQSKKLLLALALVLAPAASLASTSLVACSSTTNQVATPAPGSEAGAGGEDAAPATDAGVEPASDAATDAASEASADGGACNTVKQAAPEATSSTIKSTPPAATGGTILPGTYFLKELNAYDPAGMASPASPSGLMVTLVVAGNVMDSVQDLPDGSEQAFRETFSVSGTKLTRDITCPKPGADLPATYSVTATGIIIFETDPSMNVAASVYAKQ